MIERRGLEEKFEDFFRRPLPESLIKMGVVSGTKIMERGIGVVFFGNEYIS